jgi:hypothetical protein
MFHEQWELMIESSNEIFHSSQKINKEPKKDVHHKKIEFLS